MLPWPPACMTRGLMKDELIRKASEHGKEFRSP